MTRYLLAVSALLFFSMTPAHGQAVAPSMVPAPSVPVMTPGFSPGTPAAPVYAPNGAGLPTVGQPGQQGPEVKRSDNKRVLPDEFSAKKEPGLWAADGAPMASSAPAPFFDVPLPYPAPEAGQRARLLMDRCIDSVTDAAEQVGKRAAIATLPESARRCLAASYIFACGHDESLKLGEVPPTEPLAMEEVMAAVNLQTYGEKLKKAFCPNSGVPPEHKGVFRDILDRWMSNERDRRTSRSSH